MVVALPIFQFLNTKMSHSPSFLKLLEGFDYTVWGDFFHEYGAMLPVFMNQSVLVLGLFVLLYVFVTGGILSIFKKNSPAFSFAQFWGDSGQYFGRIFLVTAFFLLLQGMVLFAFFSFFWQITHGGSNAYLISELEFLNPLKIIVPVYLLVAMVIAMLQDYIKIHLVQTDAKVGEAIKQGLGFVHRNFSKTLLLYLLNILTFLVFVLAYSLFQKNMSANTFGSMVAILLIGQFFLVARVGGKLLNLGSASLLKNP